MAKLKLDLHDLYNKGDKIDQAVREIVEEAHDKGIKKVEIITGKGSGQLKKRVLRLLNKKDMRQLYHRIDKDSKNHGRLFLWFK